MDDWIVYHARRLDEPRDIEWEQREMYIDPLYFSGKSVRCPGPTGCAQPAPSMPQIRLPQKTFTEKQTLCSAPAFYKGQRVCDYPILHCVLTTLPICIRPYA